MLDFAKSIMVGNARTIVGQVGSSKIYYDTEEDEYYTDCGGSIYDNPGFKTKNDAVNYIVKKNKTGNSNVGNAEIVKDGDVWVVLYAEGTKSKEFNSEAEAKRFAAQVGNSKVENGALDWQIVTPKSKSAKYKMGQTVKVDGEQGTITQIQPMKLSDTPTYKIRMKSGKEIWRYEEEIGNKMVGNYSADAFLSNAKSFAKEWSAKADGYAKADDKQGLETLMRSAEAKYDEIKKYQDNAYQAYKDASSLVDDYRALGNKISKLLK